MQSAEKSVVVDLGCGVAASDMDYRRALAALETAAKHLFLAGDFDGVLRLIQAECTPIWLNTNAQGSIAGSSRLDRLCVQIGQEAERAAPPRLQSPRRRRRCRVYAVSELYRNGGHTRVLEDLIHAHPDETHHVIWVWGETAPIAKMAEILRIEIPTPVYALHGKPTDKLRRAFRILTLLDPDIVVHLGHPNDPITIALMQPASERCQLMVHHADYSFGLGRSLRGVVHVALGRHFQDVARDAWGLRTAFLPLSCREPAVRRTRAANRPFITATSGSENKFDLSIESSYLKVLAARFAARDGTHVHIGPLTVQQISRIEEHLDCLGCRDRFVHIPHVAHLSSALIKVDTVLYLDSGSTGGAKANVEAMAAGLPICVKRHNPNLDGVAFCYPECLTWTDPTELHLLFAGLQDETLARHSAYSRAHFERHHKFAVFQRHLDALTSEQRYHVG
jgi:hypothetical protein